MVYGLWLYNPYFMVKLAVLGKQVREKIELVSILGRKYSFVNEFSVKGTYLVFWEQLVLCTVLRRRKNHFKNQNSCFFFQNQEALVCKPLFPHVSNAFSQQPLSYWQKCYSLKPIGNQNTHTVHPNFP